MIDGEGTKINAGSNDTPAFKINVLRIDASSKITIDGILVRDPVFWNTLAYMSSQVTIQNYKVINRRPTTTTYNQTDGIDIDASNNCTAYNTFVYSGDDNLSPKTEQEANMNSSNITYQKVGSALQQLGRLQDRHEDLRDHDEPDDDRDRVQRHRRRARPGLARWPSTPTIRLLDFRAPCSKTSGSKPRTPS